MTFRIRALGTAALAASTVGAPRGAADWSTPPEERARTNPVPASSQTLEKGRALYQQHCASCHGDKGKGDGSAARFGVRPPEDLTDPLLQRRLTDGEIFWKISTGRRQGSEIIMPGFQREIPVDEDRWRLVHVVRALSARKRHD